MTIPKRGDIISLNFDPQAGTEQRGERPALVLSPARFNKSTGYATVCPISTTTRRWPFNIPIPDGLHTKGYVISDQIKNLDWKTRNAIIKEKAPSYFVNEIIQIIHTYIYETKEIDE